MSFFGLMKTDTALPSLFFWPQRSAKHHRISRVYLRMWETLWVWRSMILRYFESEFQNMTIPQSSIKSSSSAMTKELQLPLWSNMHRLMMVSFKIVVRFWAHSYTKLERGGRKVGGQKRATGKILPNWDWYFSSLKPPAEENVSPQKSFVGIESET